MFDCQKVRVWVHFGRVQLNVGGLGWYIVPEKPENLSNARTQWDVRLLCTDKFSCCIIVFGLAHFHSFSNSVRSSIDRLAIKIKKDHKRKNPELGEGCEHPKVVYSNYVWDIHEGRSLIGDPPLRI